MSVEYSVEGGVLRFVFEAGSLSEEIYAAVHAAYKDPCCPPHANLLMDLSASTSIATRTVEGIRTLSQFILGHPGRPGRRIALVLDPNEAERLESMAMDFAEETGLEIKIFGDGSAAQEWLNRS